MSQQLRLLRDASAQEPPPAHSATPHLVVPESTWPAVVENLPDPVLLARREATAARQVGSLVFLVAYLFSLTLIGYNQ